MGKLEVVQGETTLRPVAYAGVAEVRSNDNLRSLPRRADTALSVAREARMHGGYFHDGAACHPILPQSALPSRTEETAEAKLSARTQHYAQYVSALNVDSRTDVLTGLPNRRAFSDELRRRVQEAHQNGKPLSLLTVGVDNLARIGSCSGQEAVDQVMRKVAQIVCAAVRDSDMVTRYGWEEFAVILPGISAQEAANANRRLLNTLGCCTVAIEQIESVIVCSGIAELSPEEDANGLARRADEALRHSRMTGESIARFSSGAVETAAATDAAAAAEATSTVETTSTVVLSNLGGNPTAATPTAPTV